MQEFGGFSSALAVLTSAAGCGLLMGIERERRKGAGPDRALAGVRSFTLASLAGAAAALTAVPALVAVGAALVASLAVIQRLLSFAALGVQSAKLGGFFTASSKLLHEISLKPSTCLWLRPESIRHSLFSTDWIVDAFIPLPRYQSVTETKPMIH